MTDALARPRHYAALRKAARQTVIERYDLKSICLPQQIALIERLGRAANNRSP